MKDVKKIRGVHAPCVRPTALAALLVALALSVPVFIVVSLLDLAI